MSTEHTQGRLYADKLQDRDACNVFAHGGTSALFTISPESKARRLVACWNACEGYPTEVLEHVASTEDTLAGRFILVAQRDELLAALSRIAKWNEHTTEFAVDFGSNGVRDFYRGIASRAIRAIAKVEGGAV